MKLQKYFELIMNRSTKVLCPDCAVHCNGSKQNLNFFTIQLRLLLLIIIDDMRKFEYVPSNEFLIGNMYLINNCLFNTAFYVQCKKSDFEMIEKDL